MSFYSCKMAAIRAFEYPIKRLNLETKICITIPVIDLMVGPKLSILYPEISIRFELFEKNG